MEKIKASDFIAKYKTLTDGIQKETYIRSIINDIYVPVALKIGTANSMVDKSVKAINGVFIIDENVLFINFYLAIIGLYTTIDLNGEDPLLFYDELKSSRALDDIATAFYDCKDAGEFNMIYHNAEKNKKAQLNSPSLVVGEMIGNFAEKVNDGLIKLSDTINSLDESSIKSKIAVFQKEMQKAVKGLK